MLEHTQVSALAVECSIPRAVRPSLARFARPPPHFVARRSTCGLPATTFSCRATFADHSTRGVHMEEVVAMDRSREPSPKALARLIAVLTLLTVIGGVYAQGYVVQQLIVWRDATATATHI